MLTNEDNQPLYIQPSPPKKCGIVTHIGEKILLINYRF